MRSITRTKVLLMSVFTVAVMSLGMAGCHHAHASDAQDCTSNSVIKCGVSSPDALISKVRSGSPSDLKPLYTKLGLAPKNYSKFVDYARMGRVYKDGRVVVDGQTVANGVWSLGRETWAGRTKLSISGHTYYASPTKTSFKSDSLAAMVMFNKKGEMQFAALTSCGNPVWGYPVKPSYGCDLLQKSKVSGKKSTYKFTTSASASSNAKIVKLVYTFGDGTSVTTTNATKAVEHTYAKSGHYTARVSVYVALPGKQTVVVNSANCETSITIGTPYQECVSLQAYTLDGAKRQFRFMVTTKQGNGSTLQSADFDFGDGNASSNVKPTNDNTVVEDHAYEQGGDYTIKALVNFDTVDGVKSVACTAHVSPASPPPAAPPVTPASTKPKPVQLPNTGAGGVLGLFAVTTVAGVAAYRIMATRKLSRQTM